MPADRSGAQTRSTGSRRLLVATAGAIGAVALGWGHLPPLAALGGGIVAAVLFGALRRRLSSEWRRSGPPGKLGCVGVALALAVLGTRPEAREPRPLVWESGVEPRGGGAIPVVTETSWGETHPVIALHPSPDPGGRDTRFGPWRAVADLSALGTPLPRRLVFRLTQPLGGLRDSRTGQIAAPGSSDGVTAAFEVERPTGWETVAEVHLDLVARPEERLWHEVEIPLPHDARRVAVEARAGARGNYFFDSLRVGLAAERWAFGARPGTAIGYLVWLALASIATPAIALALAGLRAAGRAALAVAHRAAAAAAGPPLPRRTRVAGWLVSLLLGLPSAGWIAADRGVYWGDESWLAGPTVLLFGELVRSPARWAGAMLRVYEVKPPAIAWLGQLFVPAGVGLGSIDFALLLFVVLTQMATLLLVYRSVAWLSAGSVMAATGASLFVAASPLFVALSHRFHAEPLQTLAVAWCIWVMVRSATARVGGVWPQLVLAAVLAVLSKVSSPAYCFLPVGLALVTLARRRRAELHEGRVTVREAAAWLLAVAAAGMAAAWYLRNLRAVLHHAAASASGPQAQAWGKRDTFLGSAAYWLDAARQCFGITEAWLVLAAALGVLAWGLLGRRPRVDRWFALCATVAGAQVAGVLCAFSLSDNRETRYLEALLPLLAVVVGWVIAHLPGRAVAAAVLAVLAWQWAIVHAHAWGIRPVRVDRFVPMRVLSRDPGQAARLDSLVARTCRGDGSPGPYDNVLASEEIWISPAIANYVAAKQAAPRRAPGCRYSDVGGWFFGRDLEASWEDLLDRPMGYFIVWDPSTHPPRDRTYNRALDAENLPRLVRRVRNRGFFREEPPLDSERGLLIFRREPWRGPPPGEKRPEPDPGGAAGHRGLT